MANDQQLTDKELRQQFLRAGGEFFSWNSGRNTPNILLEMNNRIAKLDESIREASASSMKLAKALNRLTYAAVVISACSLVVYIVFEILKLKR